MNILVHNPALVCIPFLVAEFSLLDSAMAAPAIRALHIPASFEIVLPYRPRVLHGGSHCCLRTVSHKFQYLPVQIQDQLLPHGCAQSAQSAFTYKNTLVAGFTAA